MTRLFVSLSFLFCLGLDNPTRADWMNLTGAETAPNIAEIYVEDDRVRLVLEVYIRDLETFHDLIPDDWLKDAEMERPALAERMRRFSSETFRFVTDSGEALSAELRLLEPRLRKDRYSPFAGMINPTTRQRVPEPPEDKRVLYAEIDYPFAEPPETLTIIPPRDEEGIALVNTGFIAYHKAVPVIDFRYVQIKYNFWVDHFVAVLEVTDEEVIYVDPLYGQKLCNTHESFKRRWRKTGVIVDRI